MRVLMLSTDNKILEEGSEANLRMREYAGIFEELHLVVIGKSPSANPASPVGGRESQNEGKLFIYSTNSASKIWALWQAYKIAERVINASRFALSDWHISAQDPFFMGLVGYWLKKKFNIPLQLQVHVDFLSPYYWEESWLNKVRVILGKWLLKKADSVRVVSERIRSSILNIKNQISKIEILPIFVDVEKIKNALVKFDLRQKYPQFDFIILMASRLSREKNIGLAIEAMKDVVKKYPKAGLVIVGSGSELNHLKAISYSALPAGRQVKASVIFEDWTNDLASYYKGADVFLLTSNYEGYGRTIVEAMAAGLPVIMTDVGLAREVVKDGENGYVLDVRDARGLAERIKKIIDDKALREKFSQNNLAAVDKLPGKEEYLKRFRESVYKLVSL